MVDGSYEERKEKFQEVKDAVKNQEAWTQTQWDGGQEYKSTDGDGDLCFAVINQDETVLTYRQTSRREDTDGTDDGVIDATITDTGSEINVEYELS